MMKRILLGSIVALGAGCAHTPPATPPYQATEAAAPCVKTGSRLPSENCSTAPGRSYTKDDVDRTGAITTQDALRQLDPSITIHH
jgi:hypothetical protein